MNPGAKALATEEAELGSKGQPLGEYGRPITVTAMRPHASGSTADGCSAVLSQTIRGAASSQKHGDEPSPDAPRSGA
jgi:hypothetical protein